MSGKPLTESSIIDLAREYHSQNILLDRDGDGEAGRMLWRALVRLLSAASAGEDGETKARR